MIRLAYWLAAAILAYLAGALVYVLAAEWAGRITGHPEPEPITFAGGGW